MDIQCKFVDERYSEFNTVLVQAWVVLLFVMIVEILDCPKPD